MGGVPFNLLNFFNVLNVFNHLKKEGKKYSSNSHAVPFPPEWSETAGFSRLVFATNPKDRKPNTAYQGKTNAAGIDRRYLPAPMRTAKRQEA